MAAKKAVVKLEPYQDGKYPGVFNATVMDPSLEIWPGPGGEHPPYPDHTLPGDLPGNRPHPSHPIMLPGMPGWGVNPGPGPGPAPTGIPAVIYSFPANVPPPPVPEGLPQGSVAALVVFPGEKVATVGYFLPYPSIAPPQPV